MTVPVRLPLSTLALAVTLALAGCGGSEDRAAHYLEKGKALYEEQNYVKAKLELKNALQVDGKLAEAWFLMARIAESEQEWQSAYNQYSKVLELDPEHVAANMARARILLAAGETDAAAEGVDKVLAKEPANVDALLVRAGILARREQRADAEGVLRQVLGIDVANEKARGALALMRAAASESSEGLGLLEEGIRLKPQSIELRKAMVKILQGQGETEREIATLRDMVKVAPQDAAMHYHLAASLANHGRIDEAEKVLRDRIAQNPEEQQTQLLIVDLLKRYRTPADAEAELRKAIAAAKEPQELQLKLVQLLLEQKKADDARQLLQALIDKQGLDGYGLRARKQLAGLLLGEGKVEDGRALLEDVLKQSPNDGEALLARAGLALATRDYDRSIADLRTVIADQPDSLPAVELIVRAYLARGDTALATDELERLLRSQRKLPNAYAILAGLYGQLGRMDDAERVLRQMVQELPDSFQSVNALADLLLRTGKRDEALRLADEFVQRKPESAEGHYLLGTVHQARDEHDKAIAAFEGALQLVPEGVQPLTGMVRSYLALEQHEAASKRLEALLVQNPGNGAAMNLLGEVTVTRKGSDPKKAEPYFRKAIELAPRWEVPYTNLSVVREQQGDRKGAAAALRDGWLASGDVAVGLRWATTLERYGDVAAAFEAYEELMKKSPDNALVRNNLAMLIAQHRNDAASLDRAAELVKGFERARVPALRDTLGLVQLKRGNTEGAIASLEEAVKLAPNAPELLYHLGSAYHAAGRNTDARQQLERALASNQEFRGKAEAKKLLETL